MGARVASTLSSTMKKRRYVHIRNTFPQNMNFICVLHSLSVPDHVYLAVRRFSFHLLCRTPAPFNQYNIHIQLPTKLPKGMSARFRVGTEMANAVKDLGYMTEIGYNTFLYSNEAEARQLLMWLVERLPKDASEATMEVLGEAALFNRQLAKNVAARLESVWTPPYVKN